MNRYFKIFVFILGLISLWWLLSIDKQIIVIKKEEPILLKDVVKEKPKKFLFVGDIMLARGVREKIDQNSFDYLLENIRVIFLGMDYIIGNLEGPIVQDALPVSHNSLSFSFDKDVVDFLKEYGFNILSLANNHTNNYKGKVGFDSTISFLGEKGIKAIGHYTKCDIDYEYEDGDNYFLAFNLTFGDNGCSDMILREIEKINTEDEKRFIILYSHWGEEYAKTSNYFQKDLAHKFIDAGADLIIGSHPHVVQEIEMYKNKLVFYSLGNFIFDQYFSEETQQGLMINYDGLYYNLIPVQSKRSALSFMDDNKKREFLRELAERSTPELTKMIEEGRIKIEDN